MDATPKTRHNFRIFYTVILVTAVFAAGFIVGNLGFVSEAQTSPNTEPPIDAEQDFAAFWEVYNLIQKNYIDAGDVEVEILVNGAINGMIEALGDEFSGYIEPEVFQFSDVNLSGSIQGIGVMISLIEDSDLIEVVNVLEGTPAEAIGVLEGDIFLTVDGEDVRGFSTSQLAGRVRGPEGSIVNITFQRDEEMIDFAIERARIDVPNIEAETLDGEIAYIKLNQFTGEARSQIDTAVAELDAANSSGLILDLRGNPGGLLSSAVNVASAFIDDGVVLIEDFGDGTEQVFNANGTSLGLEVPIVVLVDERSASASELVAGAWQDNESATIIGTTTFGKGTVQTQSELINGGAVRLTIARWITPNRNWIHDLGVTPDIIIEWEREERNENPDDDPQLDAAIDYIESLEMTAD